MTCAEACAFDGAVCLVGHDPTGPGCGVAFDLTCDRNPGRLICECAR